MKTNDEYKQPSFAVLKAMFLIMFALKLAGLIAISWWVVVSPMALAFALAIFHYLLTLLAAKLDQ